MRLATDWRVQLALAGAAVGLAVAVGVALGRRVPPSSSGPGVPGPMPEAFPISDSWRAAAAGNAEAYLSCFAHEARAEREGRLARLGGEAFRNELRAAAEATLGFEWGPPQPAPEGGLRFPVTVFREDGAELLDYVVVEAGTGWRIRRVESRGRRGMLPPVSERLGPPTVQGGPK